jgi:hypothetical protein
LHDTRAGDGIASPRHGSQLLLLAAILLVTAEAATVVAIVVEVVLLAAAAVTIPPLVENLLTLALFLLFRDFLAVEAFAAVAILLARVAVAAIALDAKVLRQRFRANGSQGATEERTRDTTTGGRRADSGSHRVELMGIHRYFHYANPVMPTGAQLLQERGNLT